jgi:hypothetical protein
MLYLCLAHGSELRRRRTLVSQHSSHIKMKENGTTVT